MPKYEIVEVGMWGSEAYKHEINMKMLTLCWWLIKKNGFPLWLQASREIFISCFSLAKQKSTSLDSNYHFLLFFWAWNFWVHNCASGCHAFLCSVEAYKMHGVRAPAAIQRPASPSLTVLQLITYRFLNSGWPTFPGSISVGWSQG